MSGARNSLYTKKTLGVNINTTIDIDKKAVRIKRILDTLQATWMREKRRRAFPAQSCKNVRSLRSIGRDHVVGFDRRALFASGLTATKLKGLREDYRKERIGRYKRQLGTTVGSRERPQKGSIIR
eukprot:TRINITY_DN1096_c0_g1_i3.p2 TRINITY_DN1096_c0_g1~~TRINITY_DN1096_c0_g1_i3.p2  ORF type:complete len:125 (+),score=11.22 TRINITY_DN1096_c0_g1_i3:339-713(+)